MLETEPEHLWAMVRLISCWPVLLALLTFLHADAVMSLRQPGGKVLVEVFYETMCPYCHRFINSTLRQFSEDAELRPLVDLHMLPAGNVQVMPAEGVSEGYFFWHPELKRDKYIYRCQHGESECLGNMIHSCAIKLLAEEKYLGLIFCMAAKTSVVPERSSYECMEQLAIDPEVIKKCVRGPKANEEMYAITKFDAELKEQRTYVPWIVVNGKHLEVNDGRAELKMAVCTALGDAAPQSCPRQSLIETVPAFALRSTGEAEPINTARCEARDWPNVAKTL
mmetsp:Transcript_61389/g.142893  ORF Transcript_61389/g.142893 Transcript_61389/m.142893 type:complete len:280 (-) Transcript_61389:81-920(-)